MAARKPSFAAQVLCTVFTSLFAPILVSLTLRDLSPEGADARPAAPPAREEKPGPAAAGEQVVVASGEGATAEDALRDAVHNALDLAVSSRAAWAPDRGGALLPDAGAAVVRCEDRAHTVRWGLAGRVHCREVAVTLDRGCLESILLRAGARGR